MDDSKTVLHFQNVTHGVSQASTKYLGELRGISFKMDAGECLLLHARPEAGALFADLAIGLTPPHEGWVEFLGKDWQRLDLDEIAVHRGYIGRVFGEGGWISNLDVDENITLVQRHQTKKNEEDIANEARRLAQGFGLEHLPSSRPAWAERPVLMKAQWVRAFLGDRALLIFENPTQFVNRYDIDRLVDHVNQTRSRGVAVLWVTDDDSMFQHEALQPTARYRLQEAALHPMNT